MDRSRCRAFSLIELLTVVAILSLVLAILLPVLSRAREVARRSVCLSNTNGIAKAVQAYAMGNRQRFPYWGQPIQGFAGIGQAWDWDGIAKHANDPGGYVASNTRNLWMLVRLKFADSKSFLCPSDPLSGEPFIPPASSSAYDFQNRSQMSFSFQYQGPKTCTAAVCHYPLQPAWNTTLRDAPGMVLVADSSPMLRAKDPQVVAPRADHSLEVAASGNFGAGFIRVLDYFKTHTVGVSTTDALDASTGSLVIRPEKNGDLENVNSPNHRGEGQNVTRLDGSGFFAEHPWQGVASDLVWTAQSASAYDPTATPAATDALLARTVGLYGDSELNMLKQWQLYPRMSQETYPDSFLVP